MSADNFLAIVKNKDGKYQGFDLSASCAEEGQYGNYTHLKNPPVFEADNIDEAVGKAEKYCNEEIVEYGYRFIRFLPAKSNKTRINGGGE